MMAAAAVAGTPMSPSGTGQQMIPGFSSRSTVSVGTAASSSGHLRSRDDLTGARVQVGSYNPGTLPSVCKPVDSSRDIETLPEPDDKALTVGDDDDAVSCADSDNQPQFGSVFPVVSGTFTILSYVEHSKPIGGGNGGSPPPKKKSLCNKLHPSTPFKNVTLCSDTLPLGLGSLAYCDVEQAFLSSLCNSIMLESSDRLGKL